MQLHSSLSAAFITLSFSPSFFHFLVLELLHNYKKRFLFLDFGFIEHFSLSRSALEPVDGSSSIGISEK